MYRVYMPAFFLFCFLTENLLTFLSLEAGFVSLQPHGSQQTVRL